MDSYLPPFAIVASKRKKRKRFPHLLLLLNFILISSTSRIEPHHSDLHTRTRRKKYLQQFFLFLNIPTIVGSVFLPISWNLLSAAAVVVVVVVLRASWSFDNGHDYYSSPF